MSSARRGWAVGFAPPQCALALAGALSAQISVAGPELAEPAPERATVAALSLDPADTALRFDSLAETLRDRSSLERVPTLEAIAASPDIAATSVESLLLGALEDRDPLVAEAALRALLAREDADVLPALERHLAQHIGENGEWVRVELAARKNDLTALRRLLRNGDALVQERAFEALASKDADAAVELLRKSFEDPASLHRLQTLDLFVRSPYTNSPATLVPMLELASKDRDPLVRDRGRQLLTQQQVETTEID
jgi:hypothetical protein